MGWVNQLANDPAFVNSVEWQRVKEAHDRWSYHQSGMGPVTALVVSVVVGVATAGAGTSVMGAAGATAYPATTAAIQAGITTMANRATLSLANHDGDLGKVFEELGSSEGIKAIATSMVTAGVVQGLSTPGLLPENLANATNGSARFTDQLQRQLIDGAASAVVRSAVNGTSLEKELRYGLSTAILNTLAAQSADRIGDLTQGPDAVLSGFTNKLAHAIAGCAVGVARADRSSGCAPGALGAVVGELTAETYGRHVDTVQLAELMAALAVAVAGGDARQIDLAISAGGNAAANNYLNHEQWGSFAKELTACGKDPVCEATARAKYAELSKKQDAALAVCDKVGNCETLKKEVTQGRAYQMQLVKNGQLPDGYLGGFDLQQLGLKLANQPAYREEVGKSVVAQMLCQLNPAQCDIQSAKMAVALGVALAGGPAATYLLGSVPTIAAAARMTAAACAESPVLCANKAGALVADLVASEAVGGASVAGGALAAKTLSRVEAETEALRIIAQRNSTLSARIDGAILNRSDAQLYNDLAARAKIRPDTSRDAFYAANTDKTILSNNSFDMGHVLAGEVNPKGKATGYHAEFAADGGARIKPDANITHNANGTSEASVQVWDGKSGGWVDKKNISTFFPPSWSEARIAYEVTEAFKNKQMIDGTKWRGVSPSGIAIEGFTHPGRTTFYPVK
jgi:hypothetical protein